MKILQLSASGAEQGPQAQATAVEAQAVDSSRFLPACQLAQSSQQNDVGPATVSAIQLSVLAEKALEICC